MAIFLLCAPAWAIRNGDLVSPNEWVSVGLFNGNLVGKGCTGTLVDSDVVLTAAHCLYGLPSNNTFRLRASQNLKIANLSGETQVVLPQSMSLKQIWEGAPDGETAHGTRIRILSTDMNQELALVKLNRRFSSPPIEFASKSYPIGANALTIGFGLSLDGTLFQKHSGELKLDSYLKQNAIIGSGAKNEGPVRQINDKTSFIAFEQGGIKKQIPCAGDSGGPVFVKDGSKWILVGINSITIPDPLKAQEFVKRFEERGVSPTNDEICGAAAGVFTPSIFENIEWLKSNIEALSKINDVLELNAGRIGANSIAHVVKAPPDFGIRMIQPPLVSSGLDQLFLSWDRALTVCRESRLGGYGDWRLPNKQELQTLALSLNSLSSAGFKNLDQALWSSDPILTNAWIVRLPDPRITTQPRTNGASAMCVR